jgi:uncharacterized protein YegL
VFETAVLPQNEYTRRRADTRGSQLYIPGLIKAVSTDFAYEKIYSSRTAGGKRGYSVALAIDCSQSMDRSATAASMLGMLAIIQALSDCGIEDIGIVTFAAQVEVVKTCDDPWSPACMLSLLSRLPAADVGGTNDAIAIRVAAGLLNAKKPRKAYVFTDGQSSDSLALAKTLVDLDSEGVDVVAIGIGCSATHVSNTYGRWLTAVTLSTLPDAITSLYDEQGRGVDNNTADGIDEITLWRDAQVASQSSNNSTASLLESLGARSHAIIAEMNLDRTSKLVRGGEPGRMVVGLAFLLDITGSMIPVLDKVRTQLHAIISGDESIIKKVQKEAPAMEIDVRCALYGFRDYGEPVTFRTFAASAVHLMNGSVDQTAESHFTRDMTAFDTALKSLTASGGNDIAEDIAGALQNAAAALTWHGNAKFLLLITDAPCHGRAFSEGYSDAYSDAEAHTREEFQKAFTKLIEDDVCVMHCSCDDAATARTHDGMKEAAEAALLAASSAASKTAHTDTTRYLKSVSMCSTSGKARDASGAHIVFVLDESGSMLFKNDSKYGDAWTELCSAYAEFLARRAIDQASGDIFTVIQFSTTAHTPIYRESSSTANRQLQIREGGTCFTPALEEAKKAICNNPLPDGTQTTLIFMSDGQANDDASVAADIITEIRRAIPTLVTQVIAFGAEADTECLQLLAEKGGCEVTTVANGDMARTFVSMASHVSAGGELFREIGTRIATHVADKLVHDYL